MTEDELIGWHFQLDGHEFEQAEDPSTGMSGRYKSPVVVFLSVSSFVC